MTARRIPVRVVLAMLLLAALAFAPAGSAQEAAPDAASPLDGLHFREIGPASMAGRIDDFAVHESNPAVFYVATATGGLWKTVNNGTTFDPVFDDQPTSSIGAVAIAPDDPNLVWVGTGENNNRQSSSWGDGVYKSADGGRTWRNMGLADSRHIARIIVDPVDHDIVYVAALGSLWGAGGARGVYKTADGGVTWTRVLEVDDDTGATELVMDPTNNKVLYTATYQRRRAAWGFNGGGPGSGIYKTTDAGRTWTALTDGLPEGPKGRIGLDVYRTNPNVVYARVEHPDEGGVYRSDDGGATWRKMSDVNPRPMYFSQIRIDPLDDHRIYVLGVQLHVSDDSGRTFRNDGARNIHVDFHAMWINPDNSHHLILGGDGGVGISYDRSETYVWLNNMPLGQFYHVSYDMRTPYTVCGGLQDNNTWCGPSATRSAGGIANDDWFIIGGGDGFVALADPEDSDVLYAESQNGRMNRVDRVTNERKAIRPEPEDDETEYRWNWDTPLAISPHDPATIFVAANHVFRSTDRGHAWEVVSPDLTTNVDREELSLMGVVAEDFSIAKHDGVSAYGTITSFAESPRRAGVYYTGSDDGVVSVSRDAGASWENVTDGIPGLPEHTYVSRVAPSRFDEGTVYATFDGHRSNDFGTYVYVSTNFGESWRSIAGDLPAGEVARTIIEDLKDRDVLYLGTERGLFVTVDRGGRWQRVTANLPTVPVYEIALHPRDNAMILATHGRSLWILDDLTPLQELGEASGRAAHLFTPPSGPAVTFNRANDRARRWAGDRQFLGENRDSGITLAYYLREPAEEVALTVRVADGEVVRRIDGEATREKTSAGIHVAAWDLRVEPLPDEEGGGGGRNGPFVLPGSYRATLSVDGRDVASRTLEVAGDPDIQITDADRQIHFDTARDLHQLHRIADEAAARLREVDDRVGSIRTALDGNGDAPDGVRSELDTLTDDLDPLKRQLGLSGGFGRSGENVRGLISRLKGQILGSTSLPTTTQRRQITQVRAGLTQAVADVNALIERLISYQQSLSAQGLYPPTPKAIGPVGGQGSGR